MDYIKEIAFRTTKNEFHSIEKVVLLSEHKNDIVVGVFLKPKDKEKRCSVSHDKYGQYQMFTINPHIWEAPLKETRIILDEYPGYFKDYGECGFNFTHYGFKVTLTKR